VCQVLKEKKYQIYEKIRKISYIRIQIRIRLHCKRKIVLLLTTGVVKIID